MRIIGHGERRLRSNTALSCVALIAVVILGEMGGWLAPMERWMYDRRARYCQFFTATPTDKIVHLDIDDKALEDIGRWPWPRATIAKLLNVIAEGKPKVVAMDILFSEPQPPRWEPATPGLVGPKTPFREIRDDDLLASAMRRLNNVVLAVSMDIDLTLPSPLAAASRQILSNNLEMSESELSAALQARGFKPSAISADMDRDFLAWRRQAAAIRVTHEMDLAQAAGTPLPTLDTLQAKLLHKNSAFSPVGRDIEHEYNKVLAIRELRHTAPPVPANLPPLFHPGFILVPTPQLSDAAREMAFVDYPTSRDGVVRSVPLFIEYDGRMVPQFGLAIAARMLDAQLSSFRLTPSTVTIPGKGKNGSDIVIPVRTLEPEGGGRAIPMGFDIPWVGHDWKTTFPKQPHRGINIIYDVVHTREKVADTNAHVDDAMNICLIAFDEARRQEYASHPLPSENPLSRMDRINATLAIVNPFIPPGTKPDNTSPPGETADQKRDRETNNRIIIAADALNYARQQLPKLDAQLQEEVATVKRIVAGRAILIGWSAVAATDQKPTSLHPAAPGAVVHGMIANGILTGEMWRMLPPWLTAVVALGCGLIVTAIVTWLPPGKALFGSALVAVVFIFINAIVLFDRGNLLLGMAAPLTTIVVVWSGGTVTRLMMESIERARITRRFGSYVDPELVTFVLESQEDIFQGQEREMSVVFTDLKGFTSLSEKLGREIIPLLNEFMGLATKVIKVHRGLVNKFLGDGVMFFFNAPRTAPNHAADAVGSVLDLYVMLDSFNERLVERGLPKLALRAGVTTGLMVVGDAGSSDRSDYTVLGDNVNLASRLESANKATGTRNLMTERTVELAGPGFLFRPIARLCVVGQTVGTMVYEALARTADATPQQYRLAEVSRELVDAFMEGRAADCLEAVTTMEEEFGESLLTALYREQCECHLRDPSAGAFGGQIVLTSK